MNYLAASEKKYKTTLRHYFKSDFFKIMSNANLCTQKLELDSFNIFELQILIIEIQVFIYFGCKHHILNLFKQIITYLKKNPSKLNMELACTIHAIGIDLGKYKATQKSAELLLKENIKIPKGYKIFFQYVIEMNKIYNGAPVSPKIFKLLHFLSQNQTNQEIKESYSYTSIELKIFYLKTKNPIKEIDLLISQITSPTKQSILQLHRTLILLKNGEVSLATETFNVISPSNVKIGKLHLYYLAMKCVLNLPSSLSPPEACALLSNFSDLKSLPFFQYLNRLIKNKFQLPNNTKSFSIIINGKQHSVVNYLTEFESCNNTLDLCSGLRIVNQKVVDIIPRKRVQILMILISRGEHGSNIFEITDYVFKDENIPFKAKYLRTQELITQLKKSGFPITRKNKLIFINFSKFDTSIILPLNKNFYHPLRYLSRTTTVFTLADIQKTYHLKKTASYKYLNEWLDQNIICQSKSNKSFFIK